MRNTKLKVTSADQRKATAENRERMIEMFNTFALTMKDHHGETFYVPTEDGWVMMNFKCSISHNQVQEAFRKHIGK